MVVVRSPFICLKNTIIQRDTEPESETSLIIIMVNTKNKTKPKKKRDKKHWNYSQPSNSYSFLNSLHRREEGDDRSGPCIQTLINTSHARHVWIPINIDICQEEELSWYKAAFPQQRKIVWHFIVSRTPNTAGFSEQCEWFKSKTLFTVGAWLKEGTARGAVRPLCNGTSSQNIVTCQSKDI